MRWSALVVVAAILAAGCTDAGTDTSASMEETPSVDQEPVNETEEQREPSGQASTADCTFTYAGSRTGGGDVQLGPAQEDCDALLDPVEDEPLPFRLAYVEMAWDEADPTIDEVGFEFAFTYNGTEIGSGGASTAPGGSAGTLRLEVPLDGAGAGSVDAAGGLIFTGSTWFWEAQVVVSVFETDTLPSGYSAL